MLEHCQRYLAVLILLFTSFACTTLTMKVAAGQTGIITVTDCSANGLKAAIANANANSSGSTINFSCGSNPITITLNSQLTNQAQTTIDGGNLVTLSGASTTRVIDNSGNLTLKNLTIANGAINNSGAGVYSEYAATRLAIINCNFVNNVANPSASSDNGGGAIFSYGTPTFVSNSTFTGNVANNGSGGAIHTLRANLTIVNSNFQNNKATVYQGGAVYDDGAAQTNGTIVIQGSTFNDNSGQGNGGTVYTYLYQGNDYETIDRSSFTNNSVTPDASGGSAGAALNIGNGKFTITNSLFANNTVSKGDGGAFFVFDNANLIIANSTLVSNTATEITANGGSGNGGAIFMTNDNTSPYQLINDTFATNHAGWVGGALTMGSNGVLDNDIIANNVADNGGNNWDIGQNCGGTTQAGSNNIEYPNLNAHDSNDKPCAPNITFADPQLQTLANNGSPTQTTAIANSSPAVDSGSDRVCQAAPVNGIDQRGYIRPYGTHCDIGAFEYGATASTLSYTYNLPFLANAYTPVNSKGSFTTYLAFQNIGSAAASVQLIYFDANGNNIIATPSGTCGSVAKFGECVAPNPFGPNVKGVGIINSSQPLNIIVAEATPYGGSAYAVSGSAATNLTVPIATNGAFGGFITQINIANFGTTVSSNVTVTFFNSDGSAAPTTSTKTFSLAPNSTTTLDQSASDSGLPAGFNGWAQITSDSNGELVAQVVEQNPTTHFAAITNAQANASTTLYAPAIFNGAYGSFVTGANLVNPSSSTVTVTITYYDQSGNAIPTTSFQLAGHATQSVFQGGTSGGIGLPTIGLPSAFAGSAAITATSPILAIVNEAGDADSNGYPSSGVYPAVATGSGSVGIPVVANGGYGYTTGLTILNTSSNPISGGNISYYDTQGNLISQNQNLTIAPHASLAFYSGAAGLPKNFYGTAIVTEPSGSDLMVTTNAQSANFFYTFTEPAT